MDDLTVVKLLSLMKTDVVSPLFEEMGKQAMTDPDDRQEGRRPFRKTSFVQVREDRELPLIFVTAPSAGPAASAAFTPLFAPWTARVALPTEGPPIPCLFRAPLIAFAQPCCRYSCHYKRPTPRTGERRFRAKDSSGLFRSSAFARINRTPRRTKRPAAPTLAPAAVTPEQLALLASMMMPNPRSRPRRPRRSPQRCIDLFFELVGGEGRSIPELLARGADSLEYQMAPTGSAAAPTVNDAFRPLRSAEKFLAATLPVLLPPTLRIAVSPTSQVPRTFLPPSRSAELFLRFGLSRRSLNRCSRSGADHSPRHLSGQSPLEGSAISPA